MVRSKKPKFPVFASVVAIVAISIMIGLGFWQLDRKQQKDERLANIAQAKESAALPFESVVSELEEYQDFEVVLHGNLLQHVFYIDNVLREGKAGFNVLAPYATSSGNILLNFGWLPSTGSRTKLPSVELVSKSTITGLVYLPQNNALVTETNKNYGEFPVLLQQVDLGEMEKHLGLPLLPGEIRLLPDDSSFIREWQVVTMSPEKHLAYAVQWFGLAIAALTVFLLTLLKRMNPQATSVVEEAVTKEEKLDNEK